jgi:hypothetical protein
MDVRHLQDGKDSVPYRQMATSLPKAPPPEGLTIAEIARQIHRRIAWYGLDGLTLQAVRRRHDGHVVARLAYAFDTTCQEVIDGSTGQVRSRAVIRMDTPSPRNHDEPQGRETR